MFITIIAFLAVLGLLVLVHEWGHYITARRAGARVYEFGFGLPPRVIGVYKNEAGKWQVVGPKTKEAPNTIWSLNWIPLGGFVKIKGEEGESSQDTDSLSSKRLGVRAIVFSAGVSMNILLAIILLSIGAAFGVPQVIEGDLPASAKISNPEVRVVEVVENSPAAAAGFLVDDKIVKLNDQSLTEVDAIQQYIASQVGQPIAVTINRENQERVLSVTPTVMTGSDQPVVGVGLVSVATVSYPWYLALWYGVLQTGQLIWGVLYGFFVIIRELIVGGQVVGEVYGPVGIATLAGSAARLGILYLLQFTAILSVIIAVINYLPFPALDGGRVLFLLIELVRGKPVNQKTEGLIHTIGFAILMALIVLVTYQDIVRAVTS